MGRNVVLLILDTVRKDYFDKYASNLQELSDVSFDQCRAASSCSVPSHGSILTGKFPSESGIHNYNVDYGAVSTDETFLGSFSDYERLGVSANEYVGDEFGFSSHLDEWTNISPYHRFEDGIDIKHYSSAGAGADLDGFEFYAQFLKEVLRHEAPLQSLLNGVTGQLDQWLARAPIPKLLDDGARPVSRKIKSDVAETEEPFFMFANYMDAHYPMHHVLGYDRDLHNAPYSWTSFGFEGYLELMYNVDDATERYEDFIPTYRDLYAASIEYLDRKVASTVEWILDETDRETTVVITSDHGENLGFDADDQMFWHSCSLTEALLHVPLEIINPPEGYQDTEEGLFSQLHLGELLSELANSNTPDLFEPKVAAEIVGGDVSDVQILTEDEQEWYDRGQRAVIAAQEKVIWDSFGTVTKYDIDTGQPCWQREKQGTTSEAPDESFFGVDLKEYRDGLNREENASEVSAATEDRLKELGYL